MKIIAEVISAANKGDTIEIRAQGRAERDAQWRSMLVLSLELPDNVRTRRADATRVLRRPADLRDGRAGGAKTMSYTDTARLNWLIANAYSGAANADLRQPMAVGLVIGGAVEWPDGVRDAIDAAMDQDAERKEPRA